MLIYKNTSTQKIWKVYLRLTITPLRKQQNTEHSKVRKIEATFFFLENENRRNFICEKSVEVCESALNYVESVSESVLFCFGLFFF